MNWKAYLTLIIFISLSATYCFTAEIQKNVPAKIDKNAHYLFYLHGRIVQEQGVARPYHEKYGYYEYEKILETLEHEGFMVISEIRPKNARLESYAKNVVQQVTALIESGVPPENITIMGASAGGAIALYTSELIHNNNINYILLGTCFKEQLNTRKLLMHGKFLSIYEQSDSSTISCRQFFEYSKSEDATLVKEIQLHTNLGHGFLYKPLPEWVDPAVDWIYAIKQN